VHVEYDPERYTNDFLSIADAIESAFPSLACDGNDRDILLLSRGHALPRAKSFEITFVDAARASASAAAGDAWYSALRSGRAPTPLEAIEVVERRVGDEAFMSDIEKSPTPRCS